MDECVINSKYNFFVRKTYIFHKKNPNACISHSTTQSNLHFGLTEFIGMCLNNGYGNWAGTYFATSASNMLFRKLSTTEPQFDAHAIVLEIALIH